MGEWGNGGGGVGGDLVNVQIQKVISAIKVCKSLSWLKVFNFN